MTDFTTNKDKTDGYYERYIKNLLTNQRRLEIDDVIENVECQGLVEMEEAHIDAFTAVIKAGLRVVGIGSARKMGYGRGVLDSIQETDDEFPLLLPLTKRSPSQVAALRSSVSVEDTGDTDITD